MYFACMENFDNIDRKILSALQRDASQTVDSLAEQVGLSRNACWRRIKGYEASGLIKGRVAVLNAEHLGLGLSVIIQIRTDRHDPEWLEIFARETRAMPEIQSVHRMTGDLDYMIRARVSDMAGYDALYQRLIRKVPMSDVSASFVMEEIKDTTALPV